MRRLFVALAVMAMAACGQGARQDATELEDEAVVVTPSGPPTQVALQEGENPEAYVAQVMFLRSENGAKIYSTAGGDPLINGLYTFVAVNGEPPDGGWRVFQIGDFNSWTLLEDRGTDIVLEVSRSWIDENGEVQTNPAERMIVSVPDHDDANITITPAS